jgi:hypothetical protein
MLSSPISPRTVPHLPSFMRIRLVRLYRALPYHFPVLAPFAFLSVLITRMCRLDTCLQRVSHAFDQFGPGSHNSGADSTSRLCHPAHSDLVSNFENPSCGAGESEASALFTISSSSDIDGSRAPQLVRPRPCGGGPRIQLTGPCRIRICFCGVT